MTTIAARGGGKKNEKDNNEQLHIMRTSPQKKLFNTIGRVQRLNRSLLSTHIWTVQHIERLKDPFHSPSILEEKLFLSSTGKPLLLKQTDVSLSLWRHTWPSQFARHFGALATQESWWRKHLLIGRTMNTLALGLVFNDSFFVWNSPLTKKKTITSYLKRKVCPVMRLQCANEPLNPRRVAKQSRTRWW